jgi:Flp pilus assembly protein TadD
MRHLPPLFLACVLALTPLAAAQAAGSSSTPANPDLAQAEKLADSGDYAAAIPLLEKVLAADPKNADALNYLGYSQRKLGDRESALKNYEAALAVDPEHRGANEYLGELYLEMGDLAKAEERLAVLDKACFFGCEEYTELKESIESYKAKQGS